MTPEEARAIELVQSVLTPDLLSRQWRKLAAREATHPTYGHCYVAAEALFHLLGGKAAGFMPFCARDIDGSTHWWLMHEDRGVRLDPTLMQYTAAGLEPPYAVGRPNAFLTCQPSRRAREVIRRIQQKQHCAQAGLL